MSRTSVRPRLMVGLAALLVGLASAGCGTGMYKVTGRLLYEDTGEPVIELAGNAVTFTSEELGKSAVGEIKPDGTFELSTSRPGDGLLPGKYKVIVAQPHPMPERTPIGKVVVELDYEDPEKTPLEVVVEAKRNHFDLRLKRLQRKR